MNPLIIQTIAADQLRERHERAARARQVSQIRRAGPREASRGHSHGPLFQHLRHRTLRQAA